MNKVTPNHLLTTDELVGMKINQELTHVPGEITFEEIETIGTREGWVSIRILGLNSIATMDYRLDRLNVSYDGDGIIISVGAG